MQGFSAAATISYQDSFLVAGGSFLVARDSYDYDIDYDYDYDYDSYDLVDSDKIWK